VLAALLKQSALKLKPVSTGNSGATLARVMAGEIDIGWGAAPFGLKEAKDGKIRIVARGSDLSSWPNRTTRVAIVNAGALKARNEEILRFVKAYRETLDRMGSDAQLTKRFADALHQDAALAADTIRSFYPKQALQTDRVTEIDAAMADAVAQKVIDKPLTKEQLAELIQIPPR
jgi:NitT/TauT family transport system substrate-binding protein